MAITAVTVSVAISAASAGAPVDGQADFRQPPAPSGTVQRPFGAAFKERIPANPVIGGRSEAISSHRAGESGYAILYDYGTPIYYADRFKPRVRVDCTASWAPCDLEQQLVPIPAHAEPNYGSAAAMVVVDQVSGDVFHFWQAFRLTDRSWQASWGEVVSVAGSGSHRSTESGISRLAGVITADGIRTGLIPDARAFSTNNACRSESKGPATKSDGHPRRTDCIPQETRVQLDPALDLDRLGLSRAERAVAVALQEYVAYVNDNGGSRIAISFEQPLTALTHIPQQVSHGIATTWTRFRGLACAA